MIASVTMWHGWKWDGWEALVALGTLALAIATIVLALATQKLAREAADEIAESQRARRQDLERAGIERIYNDVVHLNQLGSSVQAAGGGAQGQANLLAFEAGKGRLAAAISLGGGAERWRQTELLTHATIFPTDVEAQSQSAYNEIAEALDALR